MKRSLFFGLAVRRVRQEVEWGKDYPQRMERKKDLRTAPLLICFKLLSPILVLGQGGKKQTSGVITSDMNIFKLNANELPAI
jgi:hypothetical protein